MARFRLSLAQRFSWLTSRDFHWLPWWQEVVLNWVASWQTVSLVLVQSSRTQEQAEWNMPSDLEMARYELEDLYER